MTRLGFRERGMSEMSGSYNAVTWLLDRNVEKGGPTNSPSPTQFPN